MTAKAKRTTTTANSKPTADAETKRFDDELMYEVTFVQVVTAAHVKFRPRNNYTVKGRVLNAIAESAIGSHRPLDGQ